MTDARLPAGLSGQILACSVTFAGVACVAMTGLSLLSLYQNRAAALEEQRTVLSHTEQLIRQIPDLKRRYQERHSSASSAHILLAGQSDSEAAANLVQTVQALAAQHQIEIASQETIPPHAMGHFRAIGVRIALTGNWAAFVALLDDLDHAQPRLLVEDLEIQRARTITEATRGHTSAVDATLSITGFRADLGTPAQTAPTP
ncbi:MAG: type II secretion system protein GspM [Acetobacter persici]|uniref:type II secretion system protein GspM n=1 Tax=Acetobacter persici TaxID=1076596 RepID=UPI0039E92B37